ncbi:MAG: TIGR02117 family protein [Cytophagales bacterium]|nr:TIGR02117 family protein [Cytophagales bacterium]
MWLIILKGFIYVLLSLVLVVLLYWVTAKLSEYIIVNKSFKEATSQDRVKIFVVSNGVHTDIAVPTNHEVCDWRPLLSDGKGLNSKYTAFGWGDKGFYLNTPTWSDLTFSTAFHAMFWKSETAMHVTYYSSLLNEESSSVKGIWITKEQYEKLTITIKNSFQLKDNKPILIHNQAYKGLPNAFYEAQGSYYFLKTCNEWTRQTLQTTGIKTVWWSPFASALIK